MENFLKQLKTNRQSLVLKFKIISNSNYDLDLRSIVFAKDVISIPKK